MPCLAIHLAVAKKYLENHPNENKEDFILGTIAPDIDLPDLNKYICGVVMNDKNSRHFGLNYKTDNIIEYMKRKVNFSLFFQSNDINTSFLRAYFLHLLCDYRFYGDYVTDERLIGLSFNEVAKIGYNDYDLITPILIDKYQLEIPNQIKDIIEKKGVGKIKLLDEELVYRFIDEMSSLNLLEEKNKIMNNVSHIIRLATKNDLDELVELKRKVWNETYRGIYSDEMIDNFDYQKHYEKFLNIFNNQDVEIYVVEANNKLVGYMECGIPLRPYKDYQQEIGLLYLLKEYQGKGIGRELFNFGFNKIKEHGCNEFFISCNKYNTKAQGFYEKMGGVVDHIDEDNVDKTVPQVKFVYKIQR